MKNKAIEVKKEANIALENLQDFVVSSALAICAFYNYETLTADKAPFEYYARIVASSVILLAALWVFWKFIKRPRG